MRARFDTSVRPGSAHQLMSAPTNDKDEESERILIELTHAARRTDQKSQQAPPPFGDRTRRPRSPARKWVPKQESPCPNGHLNRSQHDRDPDTCPAPWELPRRILTTKEGAEQLSLLEACHLAGWKQLCEIAKST